MENPWIPPIQTPESLITIYDRFSLTAMFRNNPIMVGIMAWIESLGTGDSWDGYWYNNAIASGS